MTVDDIFAAYQRHVLEYSPVAATQDGDHRRDSDLDDWPPGALDARLRDLDGLLSSLEGLGPLPPDAEGDRLLLTNTLEAQRFKLAGLGVYSHNPMVWLSLATSGVHELIRRDDLAAAPRRVAAASRAAQVPRLLGQARATLDGISVPHLQVALQRVAGAVALFGQLLPRFAPHAAEAGEAAATACEEFAYWLEQRQGPSPDWRLGGQRFGQALRLGLGVPMTAEQVWDRGLAALPELQAKAEEAAAKLLGGSQRLDGAELVRAGLEVVAADRPSRASLVSDAAAVLPEIVAFLLQTALFPTADPEALRVEELPAFMQGVFAASFFPAPPREPDASHTYYLSPVPDSWDDERATSFLREYNRSALYSIGIHEAFPGHYVQLAHGLRHPRLLRRVLCNGAFVEGWAVYVERQLVAEGFGDAALRLTSAKLAMRVVANALLDQGLHVHGWEDAQALDLMIARVYQEPAEAAGKLVRGKVTAGQLSTYFVGEQEMLDLRRDAESQPGFSAERFHHDVLAHGSPSFPVLRHDLGL
ncbi:MAG: DUF885 domain-containing protein [Egibacteraceae bacterium]